MSAVKELMKEVAAAQKNELRRIDIESEVKHLVAARMAEGTAKSRVETRTWRWVSVGSAVAAVAAVVFVVVSLHRSPFLTFTIDAPTHFGQTGDLLAPPAGQAMAAVFSDGSRVVVGDSSHARIDSVDANGAAVTLDDGHLDASIVHRAQTRWVVRAGDYQIRVTGTRFSTVWNRRDHALTVRLYEGSVVVTGPGMAASGARVRAGHVLHATAQGATLAVAEPEAPAPQVVLGDPHAAEPVVEPLAPPAEASEPAPAAPDAPPAGTASPTRVHRWVASRATASARAAAQMSPTPAAAAHQAAPAPSVAPAAPAVAPAAPAAPARAAASLPGTPVPMATTWRALARRAQYHQALTLALAEGFDRDCDQLRGDDLVLLGDVARLGGDVRRADQAYRAALRRFPDLDRPAFALGVMAFESRHDYRDAASWLSRYLHDHPTGPLATEAAGRLLEAWDLAGETARAREAARTYLRDHPNGPHKALARRLAGP